MLHERTSYPIAWGCVLAIVVICHFDIDAVSQDSSDLSAATEGAPQQGQQQQRQGRQGQGQQRQQPQPNWALQGPGSVLASLLFWLVAARTCVAVGLALAGCSSLWQAPAALLLDAAVLPHTLLLALSLETWVWQMALNLAQLKCPEKAAVLLEPGLLPELASWWPLDICGAVLEAAVAKVRPRGLGTMPRGTCL